MRKQLSTYIIAIFAIGTLMIACQDEISVSVNDPVPGDPGTITLQFCNPVDGQFVVQDLVTSTRSEGDDTDNNEFLITSLSIALYPESYVEDTTPAVLFTTIPSTKITTDEDGNSTVTLQLTKQMESDLFGGESNGKCIFYALANIPEDQLPSESDDSENKLPFNPTISQLKNLSITSSFDTQKIQDSFVMIGTEDVVYAAGTSGEAGSAHTSKPCELVRAAAKIRLNLSIPTSIKVTPPGKTEEEEWFPVTDDVNKKLKCTLSNGVKTSVTYPVTNADDTPWKPTNEDAYFIGSLENEDSFHTFSYKPQSDNDSEETGDNNEGTGSNEDNENDTTYPYVIDVPFYTYPNSWVENSEGPDPHMTSITLAVPWKQSNDEEAAYYYYQIPVTPEELTFIARNHSYTINLKVGMLGSLDPQTPIPLDNLSYQVIEWGEEGIDIKLDEIRYLIVNPNVLTINNEEVINVPFYTSHPVDITVTSIQYERFAYIMNPNNANVGRVANITITPDQIDETNENDFDNPTGKKIIEWPKDLGPEEKVITINHPLTLWTPYSFDEELKEEYPADPSNWYSMVSLTNVSLEGQTEEDFNNRLDQSLKNIFMYVPDANDYPAYFRYIITLHIEHADNSNFKEDVTITQYPAMYIQADRNPNSIINVGTSTLSFPEKGNVYVNGLWASNSYPTGSTDPLKEYLLGNIYGIYNGSQNKNPNMYVVTTTQLSPGTGYVIGDPRSLFYTNDLSGVDNLDPTENGEPAGEWCYKTNAFYPNSGERSLTYYYPTLETEATENMIAPRFRVASSWGIGTIYGSKSTGEGYNTGNNILQGISETREIARRRAATYQEQGYPAGRWRLPTLAEFTYIVQLSIDKKIPELFTKDSNQAYWTAQGAYYIDKETSEIKNAKDFDKGGDASLFFNVRPVYDEWFWSQYPQKYSLPATPPEGGYEYTLGDMPRSVYK